MSHIIVPSQWLRQPPGQVELDPSNPFGAITVWACLPGRGSGTLQRAAPITRDVGIGGPIATGNASGYYQSRAWVPINDFPGFTLLARVRPNVSPATERQVAGWSTRTNAFEAYAHLYSPGFGLFTFKVFDSTAAASINHTPTVGAWTDYAGIGYARNSYLLLANGVSAGTATTNVAWTDLNYPTVMAQRYVNTVTRIANSELSVEYAYGLRRALSREEARELQRAPYQIWRPDPRRRIFIGAAAGGAISGSATVTETADTSTASATLESSGSAALTEAADTPSASGELISSGSAALSEAADTAAATGELAFTGSAAVTEAADLSSAAATLESTGSAALTEAADAASATGDVGGGPVTGSASITEATDAPSASAEIASSGSAAITEAADSPSASADLSSAGSAAITESADTASASGTVLSESLGSASISEGVDSASAAAELISSGSAAGVEGADTAAADAWTPSIGSAAPIEGDDIASANGFVGTTGVKRRHGIRPMPKDVLQLYVEQQLREIHHRDLERVLAKYEKKIPVARLVAARAEPASAIPSQPTIDDTARVLAAILRRAPDRDLAKARSVLARAEIHARNDEDLLALIL